jgi:hypothetical protein
MTCFTFLKAVCQRVQKTKKNDTTEDVVEELLVAAVEALADQDNKDKPDKLVTFPQLDAE